MGQCLVQAAAPEHPYHVSYTELAFNRKSGNFEVAICVWPADLEKALAAQEKKPVDLEKTDKLDEMIERYVAKRFLVQSFQPRVNEKIGANEFPKSASETKGDTKTKRDSNTELVIGDQEPRQRRSEIESNNPSSESIAGQDATKQLLTDHKNEKPKSKFRWVGLEKERRQVWLYFELAGDLKTAEWTVENKVFSELNDDQLNHVQWTLDRKRYETFVCNEEKMKHRISTEKLLQKR